jgi:hypothetical protein
VLVRLLEYQKGQKHQKAPLNDTRCHGSVKTGHPGSN